MALSFTTSTYTPSHKHVMFIKGANKAVMPKHSAVHMKKATALNITSSMIRNKVFEDAAQGIVCYKDEDGQVICEGYDEGPCYQRQLSRQSCHRRDVEILDILQQTWLQIVEERKLNQVDKGACLLGDVNGFNTLF